MKEKLEAVFYALQELEIKPTPRNVSILDGAYSFLREVYSELKKEGAEDGRTQDNP